MTEGSPAALLDRLRSLEVRLWAEGDQLRYAAPAGRLTPELRDELRARKAQMLELLRKSEPADTRPPVILPVPHRDRIPLSFAQQRLWFLDQFEPNSDTYNLGARFWLEGSLDAGVLKRSLSEIRRRHEVLRTTFPKINGEPVQMISPPSATALRFVDLTGVPEESRRGELSRLAREERERPFDLARGPLLRATLFRLDTERHLLLLIIHHVVSDGWSMGVLMREIGALYNAFLAGRPSPLPELPIQYADFTHWQREWLQGEVLEGQLAYWRKQLEGRPSILQLPTDRPRPALQTFRGDDETLLLGRPLSEALKAFSQREGVTLFITLLAAFMTLLHRYTRQTDIVVGSPIANRNRVETEGLIGFFVNSLVMRADLSGDPSFRGVIERVREAALGAYDHQDLPFEKLVEDLQPERDLSYHPLFQVLFVLQNAPMKPMELSGLTPSNLEYPPGTSKFDLTLFTEETPEGILATLEHNVALFDHATMARMLGHYRALLEGLVADPEQRISRLPLLTPVEERQLVTDWNDTEAVVREDVTLHQRVEARVAQHPDTVAVVFEGASLSYAELNARANRLAHHLRKLGVGPEIRVGISLERCLDVPVAVLAVLKAGGAYVPLDPAHPGERLAFMMEDSGVSVLLTHESLRPLLPAKDARVVRLDEDGDTFARESEANLPAASTAESLVYVTYTSGSTGKPKGIAMTQRPLLNLLEWMLRTTRLPEGARTLQFASLSFDVSFQDIFSTWCSGGTLVMISETTRKDVGRLSDVLQKEAIDRLFIPAVALQQVAEGFGRREPGSFRLKKVIAGSEQLMVTQALVDMFSQLPGCTLHNEYGPSEAHVVTALALPDSPKEWPARPPIGRPISNVQIYILDPAGQPVPIGVPGELHIGGDSLARGYLGRADLTDEKFIPDPFGKRPGGRLYKTGDLARYLPDGIIEFLGRIDFQVKIRGYRIEPREIEGALEGHPDVEETVVLARVYGPADTRLVAYFVADSDRAPSATELRHFLADKLPEYMIPSAFVRMDRFPLNPNGKVDRRLLPAPDSGRPDLDAAYVAPRNDIETRIKDIWQEVLQVEKVGVNDNFFDLGGHSLLVVQVQGRLREALQHELSIVELFRYPTIGALAAHLSDAESASPGMPAVETRAAAQREALARRREMMKGRTEA